jgi:lipoprotein-anchoring transpeptidase ErfK/SrfK
MSRIRYWLSSKSTLGVTLILSGALLIVIVVAVVGFFFIQDATRWGKFPPGSKVCGVDVSGLGKAAAALKCQEQLKGISEKPLVLTLDGVNYSITPQEIGLHLDYDKMVETAYNQAWKPSIFERMYRSFVNRPLKVNGILMASNDNALVDKFITNVTGAVNQPPRNAYVDVSSGAPVIVPSRDGYEVAEATIRQEVESAENSKTRVVAIDAKKTPATLKDDFFKKLIVVTLSGHSLTLYDRQTPLATFSIACGQPAYPTPVGQWEIVSKQMNPTWYNPHDAWSGSMPETIGPGYSNPLGLRAMALNASGVLIHGTANDGSIGTSASHGCMRMHMPDVIKLFDMVDTGTPVYIISAPGNPGFDVTATPSWRLKHVTTPAANYSGD